MISKRGNSNSPKLSRRQFIKLAAAAGLLSGCGAAQPPLPLLRPSRRPPTHRSQANYFPAGEWRTSTPEEQGIDSQGIAA